MRASACLLIMELKCALRPWGRNMTGQSEQQSDTVSEEASLLEWIRRRALILANIGLLIAIASLQKFQDPQIAGGIYDLLMSFLINAFAVSLIAMCLEIFYRKVSDREKHIAIATVVAQQNRHFLADYITSQNRQNLLGLHAVQSRRSIREIGDQIKGAKSRVWLLDWWDPNLANFMNQICEISDRVDVRIAIQDPSAEVSHRAYSVDLKNILGGSDDVKNGIDGNILALKTRRYDLNGTKIRYFQTNISIPILVIDDLIYTGFYLHGVVSTERPQLVIDADEALGKVVLSEFTNVWDYRCVSEYELPDWVLKTLPRTGGAS
ncbi:hypothetical protein [Sphingomonas sp. G-3-2-10]|uniref:hypothetical protein n=1 Tax=Sphingomonas sp. G-3-2-10 TaxID=2728838 RepID=UPI00146A7D30|nr:hypothetical protein [Sphingomonas sp. G-3-2-10]NML07574.1 hypothetical protein [Sphingomonas sp. G-3-2-10]